MMAVYICHTSNCLIGPGIWVISPLVGNARPFPDRYIISFTHLTRLPMGFHILAAVHARV